MPMVDVGGFVATRGMELAAGPSSSPPYLERYPHGELRIEMQELAR